MLKHLELFANSEHSVVVHDCVRIAIVETFSGSPGTGPGGPDPRSPGRFVTIDRWPPVAGLRARSSLVLYRSGQCASGPFPSPVSPASRSLSDISCAICEIADLPRLS